MKAIELTDVSKRYNIYDRPIDRLKELIWRNRRCYHKEFWALHHVSAVMEQGASTAILGPNGSGKSTLLQIIAGVLQPTSGHMHINGRVTAILELGAGFQLEHTGRENVLLNGMILGISEEEMISRMDAIAEFADIGDFFDQPIKTYSSGMVVRLAFAAAINVDPDILLVDEALAVGDQQFQEKCFHKIRDFQARNKTIIWVTHDTPAAIKYCRDGILFNGGQIIAQGPIEQIVVQYKELMQLDGHVTPKVFSQPVPSFPH